MTARPDRPAAPDPSAAAAPDPSAGAAAPAGTAPAGPAAAAGRAAPAADPYATELHAALTARGVDAGDADAAVAEVRAHLAESGEPAADAFGPAAEYADALVGRAASPAAAAAEPEHRTITGATAFNEQRLLDEAGAQGWELVGCGVGRLEVRRTAPGRPWAHTRISGGPKRDAEMACAGWELATTWMRVRYYKRPAPQESRCSA